MITLSDVQDTYVDLWMIILGDLKKLNSNAETAKTYKMNAQSETHVLRNVIRI